MDKLGQAGGTVAGSIAGRGAAGMVVGVADLPPLDSAAPGRAGTVADTGVGRRSTRRWRGTVWGSNIGVWAGPAGFRAWFDHAARWYSLVNSSRIALRCTWLSARLITRGGLPGLVQTRQTPRSTTQHPFCFSAPNSMRRAAYPPPAGKTKRKISNPQDGS